MGKPKSMTIFEAWQLEFNEKMKKENRHVLLLIDNAGGHNISLELKNKLTNFEVFYLPANTTSVLQLHLNYILESYWLNIYLI